MTISNKTPGYTTVKAVSAGPVAVDALGKSMSFKVTAVFDKSFYAATPDAKLVCFLKRPNENGPLNVVCENWPNNLEKIVTANERFAYLDGSFVGNNVAVDVSSYKKWTPPTWPHLDDEVAWAGWRGLLGALTMMAPGEGLLGAVLFGTRGKHSSDPVFAALRKECVAGLNAFMRWTCFKSDSDRAEIHRRLVGLGPGLTPSGDDVLAGILLAVRAWGNDEDADRLAYSLDEAAADLTNPISRALLLAAANGMAAEPFHEVLTAAMRGADSPGAIRRIGRIGHSSGWDCLLGIAWTLAVYLNDAEVLRRALDPDIGIVVPE